MITSIRLSIGDAKAFTAHVLSLSFLIALLTAVQGAKEAVWSAMPASTPGSIGLLASSFLGETDSLLSYWSVPTWLLAAVAAYVVALDSTREFRRTTSLLSDLGSERSAMARLLFARMTLLTSLSFLVGVSLGLVGIQFVFRAMVVLLGAQYYVPAITPASLGLLALLGVSALLAGSLPSWACPRRRRP